MVEHLTDLGFYQIPQRKQNLNCVCVCCRASVEREHTTPGLAIVAAVAAAAQKGGAAWNSVKSLLPQVWLEVIAVNCTYND